MLVAVAVTRSSLTSGNLNVKHDIRGRVCRVLDPKMVALLAPTTRTPSSSGSAQKP